MQKDIKDIICSSLIKLPNIKISGISLDSRIIKKNYLFIAVSGCNTDGKLYIPEAIKKGACAIIKETKKETNYIQWIDKIPVINIFKLKNKLSKIAGNYYDHPSRNLKIIGVTGTNGKTTTVSFLAQFIKLLGRKSALLSTIGNGIFGDILTKSDNTTDSPLEIQKSLYEFLINEVELVAIEVSSHGLIQNRVKNIKFNAAAFTNLTHDHLDYHKNMMNYEKSKFILFNNLDVGKKIINTDSYIGSCWIKKIPDAIAVSTECMPKYTNRQFFYINVNNIKSFGNNNIIPFSSSWGSGYINTNFFEKFNIKNMAIALTTLLSLNYSLKDLINCTYYLTKVPGRMEIIKKKNRPTVVIDYAHTPEALKQVLIVIKKRCYGKVWCIFGCGGSRDRSKRSIMGRIATEYANKVIITDDNPRYEDSQKILQDITKNLKKTSFRFISDRQQAIKFTIKNSKYNDWILIAGKGCEEYQIYKDKKILHSDYKVAKKYLDLYDKN